MKLNFGKVDDATAAKLDKNMKYSLVAYCMNGNNTHQCYNFSVLLRFGF